MIARYICSIQAAAALQSPAPISSHLQTTKKKAKQNQLIETRLKKSKQRLALNYQKKNMKLASRIIPPKVMLLRKK